MSSVTNRSDRSANTQAVIAVIRTSGPITQADISRETGLSRATVNNIVQALRDRGTIEYQWKNRREALVSLVSTRKAVITLKVSERAIVGTLFDFSAETREDHDLGQAADTRSSPAQAIELARRLIARAEERGIAVAGIAVAIEGPIERSTGAIAPWAWQRLPHWKGVAIGQVLGKQLHLPLIAENDANLAALGEWSWGEGRGSSDFLHITCSEGVGGGFIVDGRIYRGGTGLAGEIGHMVIEADGDLCFCGSRGCLSSFLTERSILNALRTSEHPKQSLTDVIASARAGDAACQRVLFEAGVHLGRAIATVVRVMAPGAIAIGGKLSTAGDIMLDGLRSSPDVINLRAVVEGPRISIGALDEDAIELGGVAAILSEIESGTGTFEPWMRKAHDAPVPA